MNLPLHFLPLHFLPRTVRCLRGILLLLLLLNLAETTQAQTTIRYVKPTASGTGSGSSWADASGDLQSQINIAGARQVWVAGGRYTASGSFLLRNGVAVYGGFRGDETSLVARPVANPVGGLPSSTTLTTTAGAVIQATNLDNTARLDAVVISGGSNHTTGGGILNQSSSPVLTNCLISGNTAGSNGGGMANENGSSPVLINCVIGGNTAGGNGGGIANESGSSAPVLTNCIVSGNTAGGNGGGVYNSSSNPVLTNCVLQANSANLGGGVYNDTSSPRLVNCTLTANRGRAGVALGNYNSSQPVLTNGILWNNQESTSASIGNDATSGVTARYCLIGQGEADFTGPGNLTATSSPFVSETNLQLNTCVLAINSGDPASTTATSGTTDLAGNPRFYQGGGIDMGAYEFQATGVIVSNPAVTTATVGVPFSQIFTASGGTGPYSHSAVSGNLPASLSLSTAGVLSGTPTVAGSYSLTVQSRDAAGCIGTSAVYTLTVRESVTPPVLAISGFAANPGTVCVGRPVTFTATVGNRTGSYTYSLTSGIGTPTSTTGTSSNGVFNQTLTANGSGVQAFTLTVSSNGQSATATTSLTVNALPAAGLTNNGPLTCGQTSVTLTASGGRTGETLAYQFSSGATQVNGGNTATVTTPGPYSVTLTTPSGCVSSTSTTVMSSSAVVGATVSASLSTTLSCTQTSLTLTADSPAGVPGNTYAFSGPGVVSRSGNTAVVNTSGLYSVTVTNTTTGCFSVTSINISQDNSVPAASLVSSGTLSCAVTSVTLTAGLSGSVYRFSAGATQVGLTNQATVSAAGLYSVTVSSGSGCSSVAATTVFSRTAVVNVTNPALGTAAQGVAFSQAFTASGGVSPYSYSLASGSLPASLSLSTAGVLSGTPTQGGTYSLTVRVTDASGCSGVSIPYSLTVGEPVMGGPLRLIQPLYDCQTGAITFRTVGGDGGMIEYRAVGVTDWTINPNQTVDIGVRQDINSQPLPLQARQGGAMATFTFDFRLFCAGTVPGQPTGSLAVIQPLYNCQTGAITFQTRGGDTPGTPAVPIYFTVPGVVSYSTQTSYVLDAAIRNDVNSQPLLIKAKQGGTVATYVFDFRAFCSASGRLSAEPTPVWTVRVSGNPIKDNLTVVISGAQGQTLALRLSDMSGRVVATRRVMPVSATHREVLTLDGAGGGLLLLQVTDGGRSQTVKVLKE